MASSPPAQISPGTNPLIRCPPYCPNDCQVRHHPLLVVLLNCSDVEDQGVMKQKLQNLEHIIHRYQQEGKWTIDSAIPDGEESYRYPPVHWACALGRVGALLWLVEHGALPGNIDTADKVTGLHRAIVCLLDTSPREAAEKFRGMLIIMEKALVMQDKDGNTPLHTCGMMLKKMRPKQEFYVDCARSILEYVRMRNDVSLTGCLSAQNVSGDTIMHLVCHKEDFLPLIKDLHHVSGDNFHIPNVQGLTPLDLAQLSGEMRVSTYLQNYQRQCSGVSPAQSPGGSTVNRKSSQSAAEDEETPNGSQVSAKKGAVKVKRSNSTSSSRSVTPTFSSPSSDGARGKRPSTSKYAINRSSPSASKGSPASNQGSRKRPSSTHSEDEDVARKQVHVPSQDVLVDRQPAETTNQSLGTSPNKDKDASPSTEPSAGSSSTPDYYREGALFIKYLGGCSEDTKGALLESIVDDKRECSKKVVELTKSQSDLNNRLARLKEEQHGVVSEIQRRLDELSKLQREEGEMKEGISRLQNVKDTASGSLRLYKERLSHCQAALNVLENL